MKKTVHINFFNRVSFLDTLLFTKHLSVLVKSGIPLKEAIESVGEESKNKTFRRVIAGVLKDIENGQTLYNALSKYPQIFNPFYISLVKISEESGNLDKNLDYLADQLKRSYEFKKKIQSALLYPEIVLGVTVVAGAGISVFVLPKLIDLFSSLDVKLPLATQILLFVAATMRDFGILILTGAIILLTLFRLLIQIPKIKKKWQAFLLWLPVLGTFNANIQLSQLCRNMGIMLKSGLPITTAISVQISATDNLIYRQYLREILKGIEKGHQISQVLLSHKFKHIPGIFEKIIAGGEKSGKLDESFLYLGDFFEEDVDTTSKNLPALLEPIMLIVISLVVAFVALAIISPIYEFTSSIKR